MQDIKVKKKNSFTTKNDNFDNKNNRWAACSNILKRSCWSPFFGKKVLLINIKDTKTSIVCITLFMTA